MENQEKNKKKLSLKSLPAKWKGFSKKKKIISLLVLFAVIFATTSVASMMGGPSNAALKVKAGSAKYMNLRQEVSVKGTVAGTDSANVYSSAPYRISQILVKEGDRVTEGQVLAELDAAKARTQYNQAAIAVNDAKRAYDIASNLYAEGALIFPECLSKRVPYFAISKYSGCF